MDEFLGLLGGILEVLYIILETLKGLCALVLEVAARSQRSTSGP